MFTNWRYLNIRNFVNLNWQNLMFLKKNSWLFLKTPILPDFCHFFSFSWLFLTMWQPCYIISIVWIIKHSPRNSTKEPTELMAATLNGFDRKVDTTSQALLQKFLPLIATIEYAFCLRINVIFLVLLDIYTIDRYHWVSVLFVY